MKKNILWISLMIMSLFVLTACGTSVQADIDQAVEQVSEAVELQAAPDQNLEREMPQSLQLALGIFALEDTSHPITPEQAAELLTLWKAARSLNQSETVAAEELQAVVRQIRDIMTPEQLDLVISMDLSFEDMGPIADKLGLDFGMTGRLGEMTPEMQATMQAMRESGQAPEGGFGGGSGFGGGPGGGGSGGGSFGGETGLSPEQRATAIAERDDSRQVGLGVPVQLLDAIIEFLSTRAG